MNRGKSLALVALATLTGLMAGSPSDADARGRSGGGSGHASGARSHGHAGHHGAYRGSRVGVAVRPAVVVRAPVWYSARGFYGGYPYLAAGGYYTQDQGVVYVEQSPVLPQQLAETPADGYWYYCTDSKTYFPYVQTCASPWQRVIPYASQ